VSEISWHLKKSRRSSALLT